MFRGAFAVVVLVAVTGSLVAWLRGVHQADDAYTPRIVARTWTGEAPAVAIDDAHWNGHTAKRGYGPFVQLLRSDGYNIIETGNVASPAILATVRVVVIANALGFNGVVRQAAQAAGLDLDALGGDAFTDAEAQRIETWVREGGSLLLAADETPAGRAAQSLAEMFGVRMYDAIVLDPEHSEPESPWLIVFSRDTRTLGEHPIIAGASKGDSVNRVVTFRGQALDGPSHATKLLMFSGTAYQTSRDDSSPEDRLPVAGLAQALAFTHGGGRVVVLGDAALLTSQLSRDGPDRPRIGLTWPNADNERFARHIMRWLSRAGA